MKRIKSILLGTAATLALGACGEGTPSNTASINPVTKNFSAPYAPSTPYERGKQFFEIGQFGSALEQFHRALADEPRSFDALNALGATYDQLGRYEIAEQYYRRALLIAPNSAATLNNLGYSYILQGKRAEAQRMLERAAALDPNNVAVQANIARLDAGNIPGAAPRVDALIAAASRDKATPAAKPADPGPRVVRQSPKTQVLTLQPAARRAPEEAPLPMLPRVEAPRVIAAKPSSPPPVEPGVETTIVAAPTAPVVAVSAPPISSSPRDLKSLVARQGVPVPSAVAHEPPRLAVADDSPARVQPAPLLQRAAYAPTAAAAAAIAGAPGAIDRGPLFRTVVEVSNGTGRRFQAARMGAWLKTSGLSAVRLTNAESFTNRRSVIYYREGHRELAFALLAVLPREVAIEPAAEEQRQPLRLKLGADLLEFDAQLIARLNGERWS